MIENDTLRVRPVRHAGGVTLQVDTRDTTGKWRTVLSNHADHKHRPWDKEAHTAIEDIEFRPSARPEGPVFSKVSTQNEGKTLVRQGPIGGHLLEEELTVVSDNHLGVKVRASLEDGPVAIERLMNHYYFVPDGRAMGYALPLDFAWMPGLHVKPDHVAGDHFFRSPAVIVFGQGMYAAIIPDLNLLNKQPELPHALDLRSWLHKGSGEVFGLPRLSYGVCAWRIDGHVTTVPDKAVEIESKEISYAFDLLVGFADDPGYVTQAVTELLWQKYGHRYLKDIRPQVLPFEEYGRQYTYAYELNLWVKSVQVKDKTCYGINNTWRRGANFHAWENDMHTGFGIRYYGCKWEDDKLRNIGNGIMGLLLSSPTHSGAFPCIYNFEAQAWEGSLYWTSWPGHPYDGYDLQAMGVTAWWMLYWYEHFTDLPERDEIISWITGFCRFLINVQEPSGAIPTYYSSDLQPSPQLREAAPTAIGGAVLAKMAEITGDATMKEAAVNAGMFLVNDILPGTKFFDFELFYSCSPKPLYWVDPVNGIPPVNTLAVQWSADHFLALYRLTDDKMWLKQGEYCLSVLSLFQQVWAPNRYGRAYMFGGFGVMNCDGEWNDGRQSRFVPTYADYYLVTGKLEYLERAIAACRSSFAAMDMKENHANDINDYQIIQAEQITVEPGRGLAPESIMHGAPHVLTGEGSGWTGINWGPGGGLGASAYLEHHFGGVWIDGGLKEIISIDGVSADLVCWDQNRIEITMSCALKDLAYPYTTPRTVVAKFGELEVSNIQVIINGKDYGHNNRIVLSQGLNVEIS
jgi:hypothetical protein